MRSWKRTRLVLSSTLSVAVTTKWVEKRMAANRKEHRGRRRDTLLFRPTLPTLHSLYPASAVYSLWPCGMCVYGLLVTFACNNHFVCACVQVCVCVWACVKQGADLVFEMMTRKDYLFVVIVSLISVIVIIATR